MKTLLRTVVISLTILLLTAVVPFGRASAFGLFGITIGNSSGAAANNAASSPAGQPATTGSFDTACLVYANHVYEVCTAYIANASLAVLVPYYQYANSPDPWPKSYVTYRLGQRYTGNAYTLLTRRAAAFGPGNFDVGLPSIRILAASSSLATNTATLQTEESWQVRSESGRIVYSELNQRHTVSLQRVPSYILHKWVVTDIR